MPNKAVITCKGHPNIKATHAKTFEFTHDTDITQTGTCIIGIDCEYDEEALLALRGSVRIHLSCNGTEEVIQARMNPLFRRGDPLIIRRNDKPQPRTLCTSSSRGSSALSRELVKELQKPGAELVVTITQVATQEAIEGVIYIVGMPIGNSSDISLRALDILQSVDAVIAEDTRTARAMLAEFGITSEFISYHDHNERNRTPQILARLQQGDRIALVSEAGMPLISDPGFHIVSAAIEHNIEVCPVPGPDAVTTALSLSGISAADFRFIGFPPRKTGARTRLFEQFKQAAYAVVFFESPHRIVETLNDIQTALGDRHIAVCKDLTKHTQHIYRGTAQELSEEISQQDKPRGELAIVIEGAEIQEEEGTEINLEAQALVQALLDEGCPTKMLASAISKTSSMKKRDPFAMIVNMKESD